MFLYALRILSPQKWRHCEDPIHPRVIQVHSYLHWRVQSLIIGLWTLKISQLLLSRLGWWFGFLLPVVSYHQSTISCKQITCSQLGPKTLAVKQNRFLKRDPSKALGFFAMEGTIPVGLRNNASFGKMFNNKHKKIHWWIFLFLLVMFVHDNWNWSDEIWLVDCKLCTVSRSLTLDVHIEGKHLLSLTQLVSEVH